MLGKRSARADPVLPQVWRWTTNQLATMLARTNVGLGYVHLPSGLNSEDVAGWDGEKKRVADSWRLRVFFVSP